MKPGKSQGNKVKETAQLYLSGVIASINDRFHFKAIAPPTHLSSPSSYRQADMLHLAAKQVRSNTHDGRGVAQAKAEQESENPNE